MRNGQKLKRRKSQMQNMKINEYSNIWKRNGQKAKPHNWKLVLLFPVSINPSSNTVVSKNMKLQFYLISFTLSRNRVCTTNKPSQLYCSIILAQ